MTSEEKRARLLLSWASALCVVSLLILFVDHGIKRQVLEAVNGQKAEQVPVAGPVVHHTVPHLVDPPRTPATVPFDASGGQQPETD